MRFLFLRRTIHVYLFSLLTNPVTISVLVLCVLCLTGLNVLLSMLIACIIGGVAGGIPLLNAPEGTQTVMQLLTGGFASNATTALAYILLGTFATCIATTGLADILSKKTVTPARRTQAGAHRCADTRCLPVTEPHSGAYRIHPDSRAAAAPHDEPYAD